MPLNIDTIPGGKELIDAQKTLETAGIIEGMRVGDLGCGARGLFALQTAKLVGRKGLVYAIDILKNILHGIEINAKEYGLSNIKTVWSDLEIYGATKIQENSLDMCLLINVLFQTKDDKTVIREAARLLKNGGRLLVVDWEKTGAPFGPKVEERVNVDALKKFAQEIDMILEKEFEPGPYHFATVFIKK